MPTVTGRGSSLFGRGAPDGLPNTGAVRCVPPETLAPVGPG